MSRRATSTHTSLARGMCELLPQNVSQSSGIQTSWLENLQQELHLNPHSRKRDEATRKPVKCQVSKHCDGCYFLPDLLQAFLELSAHEPEELLWQRRKRCDRWPEPGPPHPAPPPGSWSTGPCAADGPARATTPRSEHQPGTQPSQRNTNVLKLLPERPVFLLSSCGWNSRRWGGLGHIMEGCC